MSQASNAQLAVAAAAALKVAVGELHKVGSLYQKAGWNAALGGAPGNPLNLWANGEDVFIWIVGHSDRSDG